MPEYPLPGPIGQRAGSGYSATDCRAASPTHRLSPPCSSSSTASEDRVAGRRLRPSGRRHGRDCPRSACAASPRPPLQHAASAGRPRAGSCRGLARPTRQCRVVPPAILAEPPPALPGIQHPQHPRHTQFVRLAADPAAQRHSPLHCTLAGMAPLRQAAPAHPCTVREQAELTQPRFCLCASPSSCVTLKPSTAQIEGEQTRLLPRATQCAFRAGVRCQVSGDGVRKPNTQHPKPNTLPDKALDSARAAALSPVP